MIKPRRGAPGHRALLVESTGVHADHGGVALAAGQSDGAAPLSLNEVHPTVLFGAHTRTLRTQAWVTEKLVSSQRGACADRAHQHWSRRSCTAAQRHAAAAATATATTTTMAEQPAPQQADAAAADSFPPPPPFYQLYGPQAGQGGAPPPPPPPPPVQGPFQLYDRQFDLVR
jgi:hypothetical protein